MSDRLTVEQLRSAPIGVHISRRARRGEYDPEQVIGTPQECVDAGSLDQRVLAYPIPGEIRDLGQQDWQTLRFAVHTPWGWRWIPSWDTARALYVMGPVCALP